jgi:hypothetical protein
MKLCDTFGHIGNYSRRNVIRCGSLNLLLHPPALVALTGKLWYYR